MGLGSPAGLAEPDLRRERQRSCAVFVIESRVTSSSWCGLGVVTPAG
jgi:hypothetical protein